MYINIVRACPSTTSEYSEYILEWAAEHRSPVKIVVSQPRRLAAISVSERISKERGEAPGTTVGYQIRMNRQCSSNTVLMLTTSGCLLRALAMDKESFFKNTTHLIIDEAHERDLDTDFLLLATKLELQKNPHLRLVLMSATMDLEALSNYFGGAP
ncbi:DExH-box ATP-dependent RNA helicase DExH3-like [Drosophila mauritiana]|uniref:DExH-box ATP-dependent RNA helicase DExH3-like n=1 Tax=Drosophila mauritiana TaxID=7226 RepID=A0A6P8KLE8_DROMA|nr:DExH-box ATP-dependent RNA helicase DExH3-like [Drosophila mauritiana]